MLGLVGVLLAACGGAETTTTTATTTTTTTDSGTVAGRTCNQYRASLATMATEAQRLADMVDARSTTADVDAAVRDIGTVRDVAIDYRNVLALQQDSVPDELADQWGMLLEAYDMNLDSAADLTVGLRQDDSIAIADARALAEEALALVEAVIEATPDSC